MKRGTIVKILTSGRRGMALNSDEEDNTVNVLLYDFSTAWICLDDVEPVGYSDAIYKCMYEMMQ